LRAMRDQGFEAVGTELPGFAFFAAEGVQFVHAPAEALPFDDEAFDAVSLWHVLEHTTDPAAVLREIARVLKPRGVLALAVPNFGSAQARRFGRHWFHLDLPRHLYHFREASLRRQLQEAGLTVIEIRTQAWDQNLYGFVQSFLNRIFWKSSPNGLYQFLKKRAHGRRAHPARLLAYFVLGACAAPVAFVENIVSPWRGRGATLIMYCRKAAL
jgi:SAM-dependent methyltransferase